MLFKNLILSSLSAIILAPACAFTQQADQSSQGYSLTTDPSGATVYLDGEYKLITNTPARLPSNLSGKYDAKIVLPGYENWKGELNFAPGASENVNINLSRKTPFKAGLRSLFIPGWGQHYSGNTTRGGMYLIGAFISAGGLYLADRKYQDKRADYDIASQRYADARSITEQLQRKVELDAAQRVAYKAENDRRTVFYINVGVWALNFLDAIIFFPDNDVVVPSVSASIEGEVMINYVIDF
jgi:hypothetical protein